MMCLALVSCTDHSYRGMADMDMYGTGAFPVLLSVGPPSNIVNTKGTGAIDVEEQWAWNGSTIYVYAFKKDITASFATTRAQNPFHCLVDASKDGENLRRGKKAKVNDMDSFVIWGEGDNSIYYHPEAQPYDFYAYYLDDYEVPDRSIVRSDNAVRMPVVIDGSRDFMSSTARITDEQLNKGDFTDGEKKDIMKYAFSAYTANRNIHPVLYFNHHLSRLCFSIYAGQEKGQRVSIESIEIMSRTKAMFTVAHRTPGMQGLDFSADNEYKALALPDKIDGQIVPLRPDTYYPIWESGDEHKDPYDRKSVRVGESLLVAPDTEYDMIITTKEIPEGAVTPRVYEYHTVITSASGRFEPGKQYEIRVLVNGAEKIDISAELVPWGYGGDLVVDEEDEI